jgi:gluconokinase
VIIVVTGVTGAGKTTVGKLLASELGWSFYDADDSHPAANIEKLRRGDPLNDDDRKPWLAAVRELIRMHLARGDNTVIACSALKESYREFLRVSPQVVFVYLKAAKPLVQERLENRTSHFMNPKLVESQFDTLEESGNTVQIDASLPPAEIVERIKTQVAPQSS